MQSYAIHDGEGIRTTVFFKGCPLRCAWCHNPETQSFEAEWLHHPERCIGCGRCASGCPTGARTLAGQACTADALCALLLRERVFYDASGGGVTLSGGEPLAQDPAYLLALCRALHQRGVRVAVDTCGHVPYARFAALLPYVDTFLYDIKAADPALHARYTGVDNALILDNLRRLGAENARIRLRVPVVPGVNTAPAEMARIVAIAREAAPASPVHLLPYHRLGQHKHVQLNAHPPTLFDEPSPALMEALALRWREAGFAQVILGG